MYITVFITSRSHDTNIGIVLYIAIYLLLAMILSIYSVTSSYNDKFMYRLQVYI